MSEKKQTSKKGLVILLGIILLSLFVYVNFVSGVSNYNFLKIQTNISELRGSNLTGSDGAINRTFNISGDIKEIIVDGFILQNNTDYVVASETVKFINRKWNEQYITIKTEI